MKATLIVFSICIFLMTYSFGQNDCREIETIIDELKVKNYVADYINISGLGYGYPKVDSQLVKYEELKRCTSKEELWFLIKNENSTISTYAWKAFLLLNPSKALDYLISNKEELKEREVTTFLNGCQGSVKMAQLDYMVMELYDRLLKREIILSANDIIVFLNFKERRTINRVSEDRYKSREGF